MVEFDTQQLVDETPALTIRGKAKAESIYDRFDEMSFDQIADLDYDEFADDFGIQYVGGGAMRAVFTTTDSSILTGEKRSVLKVIKGRTLRGNVREIANWHLINEVNPSFADERLATLYDYDTDNAKWLVMEMAPDYPGYYRASEAKSVFEDSGFDVADYGTSNTGLIDGKVVLIDYGLKIEAVEENEKLEDTIYDEMPISERLFEKKSTSMEQEVSRLISRVRENNVTQEDIIRAYKQQEQ